MCWFADWVTLLSARCKYKIITETDVMDILFPYFHGIKLQILLPLDR